VKGPSKATNGGETHRGAATKTDTRYREATTKGRERHRQKTAGEHPVWRQRQTPIGQGPNETSTTKSGNEHEQRQTNCISAHRRSK